MTSLPSRELRQDRAPIRLEPSDRVVIVAGSGQLPVAVAGSLRAAGHEPFVVMIAGERTDSHVFDTYENRTIELEHLGDLLPLLKRVRATHVVLAGGIERRPRLWRLKPGWYMFTMLARVARVLGKGDNALLSTLVGLIEEVGPRVVGAHELVPDLLAFAGPMSAARPGAEDRRDLDLAMAAARAIGALDIGQAAVAVRGRVIALEGIEGTDALLERAAELRNHPRLAGRTGGVLVKCAKPGQELRADLPAIGPQTVEAAHRAGLSGIGVEAGRSLVLDFQRVRARADELGLFVFGLPSA